MHFIDLQILILSLEIDNLKEYLRELRKQQLKENGIDEIQEASANDIKEL